MLSPQLILPMHSKLVVDLFAGGGGASTGIEQAIGQHGTAMRTECLWLNPACADRSGWLFGIDTDADACAA